MQMVDEERASSSQDGAKRLPGGREAEVDD